MRVRYCGRCWQQDSYLVLIGFWESYKWKPGWIMASILAQRPGEAAPRETPRRGIVFLYTQHNRYSVNALTGAIESDPELAGLPLYFPRSSDALVETVSTLIAGGMDLMCCVSFCTPAYWDVKEVLARLRRLCAGRVFVVAGGPHPSAAPESVLGAGVDVVVAGEAELVLPELIKRWVHSGDLTNLPALRYRAATGGLVSTPQPRIVDLDSYSPFGVKHKKFGPIEITRGCPFACGFCQTSYLHGRKVRHRSVGSILKHVETLLRYGLSDIRFISPNAFGYGSATGMEVDLKCLESLLSSVRELVGRRGRIYFGTFPSEVRPEHVRVETVELVRRYCDNTNLVIGGQSGSQRILDLCGRRHSVDDVVRAAELTRRAGLIPNVDLIFGLPGETPADLHATLKLAEKLVQLGTRIHAHAFIPLPGTRFAAEPPATLPRSVLSELGRFAARGHLYGQWQRQLELAGRIVREFHQVTMRSWVDPRAI